MKAASPIVRATCPKTMAGYSRTACATKLWRLLLLLTLPATVQAQFNYTTNSGTITITKYTGPGGAVTIPDTINGLPVTSIGDHAFDSCYNMTSVTIPNSITSIGWFAFEYCTHLASVTIPNSVTNLGVQTFCSCTRLTSVTIGNGVTSIDGWVFVDDTILTSVTIPNIVTNIDSQAFSACHSLTSVTIPDSVISIGTQAFGDCGLTSVTIPNSVTSIGQGAFAECTSLTEVHFTGNAPNLGGSSVFYRDNNATVYYLPGTTGWGTTFGGRPAVLWDPPAIQTPPQTQTAEAGSAVGLRVKASGSSPLFCVWYLNDTNLISCSTYRELNLTNLQLSQSGAYTVVVSNALGAVTSAPAMLNVIAAVERRPVPGVKVTGGTTGLLNVDYANSLSLAPNWTTLDSVSLTSTSQYYFDLTAPLPPHPFSPACPP